MQYFTIRDIENLTGIKAHTLRIWEKRYALFIPKRKSSAHRVYDNEDLKQLLRISFLYHNGWKISKIAKLSPDAIINEVRTTEPKQNIHAAHIVQLMEAAIDFNEPFFSKILEEVIQTTGFERCITEVCYPFLQRVGMLWVTNNIIPAQEHFSSYIIQNKIIAETDKLKRKEIRPNLILFAPTGEFHELPLLYLNYLFRKKGWGIVYLGSNTNLELLKQFTPNKNIEYLFLHLITNFTGQDADDYFETLCRTFPDRTILATGTIIQQIQRNFINLKLLRSDTDIYHFINNGQQIQ